MLHCTPPLFLTLCVVLILTLLTLCVALHHISPLFLGGIPKLVRLAGAVQLSVRIEAIAALANLAVNGAYVA